MDGASSEEQHRHLSLHTKAIRGSFARLVSRASLVAASLTFLTALVVVYRLWALATSRQARGFPEGWLFDLGDFVVSPFRGYDHTEGFTKATGYIDFPALVALEVCLVALFVFSVLSYLFYLLQPHPPKPAKAPRPARARKPSRVQPWLRHNAVRGNDALRRGLAPAVAAAQRPDWQGYRARAGERWNTGVLALSVAAVRYRDAYVAGVKDDAARLRQYWQRGSEAYVAGVRRDAVWLREHWQLAAGGVAPFIAASDRRLLLARHSARRSLRRGRIAGVRFSRASGALLTRTASRAAAALGHFGATTRAGIERGSNWYWRTFDAASNRVGALFSRQPREEAPLIAEPQDAAPATDTETEAEQLSRREFLRRLRPLR
jgi:hypothetical protein